MKSQKKQIIHVNQHVIRSNHKKNERFPVLSVKTGSTNTYAHEVIIKDEQGNPVARVVYSPGKPLPCGAKVWIETYNELEIVSDYNQESK